MNQLLLKHCRTIQVWSFVFYCAVGFILGMTALLGVLF